MLRVRTPALRGDGRPSPGLRESALVEKAAMGGALAATPEATLDSIRGLAYLGGVMSDETSGRQAGTSHLTRQTKPVAVFTRRTFLLGSAAAACALGPSSHATPRAAETAEPPPAPCPPTRWKKHGVIIEATEPWEGSQVQNFTARAEPLGEGRWRLWYSVSDQKHGFQLACAEGRPGEPLKKTPVVCSPGDPTDAPLSLGNLPESWKPVQPVHLLLRNGRHRLYFWAHGPQITRYLAAESEDGRRYRVLNPLRPVLYHPNDRATWGVPSPDGVVFRATQSAGRPAEEPLATAGLISNDATNLYQLPDGSFEMYSVALVRVPKTDPAYVAEDNAPGLLRVIDRYTSADGLRFENRQRVIQRDSRDPVDQQFYYLAVTHVPRGRIGLLGHYRCRAQTMDLEWCFSRDGVAWQRPHRTPWLPRGEPPAPDCYGIYAGSQLVEHGGRWHLFYTGVNSSHNERHSHGPARQVVMLATTEGLWA